MLTGRTPSLTAQAAIPLTSLGRSLIGNFHSLPPAVQLAQLWLVNVNLANSAFYPTTKETNLASPHITPIMELAASLFTLRFALVKLSTDQKAAAKATCCETPSAQQPYATEPLASQSTEVWYEWTDWSGNPTHLLRIVAHVSHPQVCFYIQHTSNFANKTNLRPFYSHSHNPQEKLSVNLSSMNGSTIPSKSDFCL